jgi:hypothetical protein
MIVTSFYTNNGKYPALAARLRASCERLAIRHHIVELPDNGDWKSSNNFKPHLIMSTLLDNREPVLWCDADCEILAPPEIPDSADFAEYNWKADLKPAWKVKYDPSILLGSGGVIYFKYTAPALELLVRWVAQMNLNPAAIDDQVLDVVYNQIRPPVTAHWLDKRYNWMTGLFGMKPPADCVIRHDYIKGGHRANENHPGTSKSGKAARKS